ncbi:MAG: WD40/YVTN/BNR-like repeat-containing protein [Bryobacteraceae bacterium]
MSSWYCLPDRSRPARSSRRAALGALLPLLGLCVASAAPPEHWRLQYFYDADNSRLVILDLNFPTPQLGMAVGHLFKGDKVHPAGVVTRDGGRSWAPLALPRPGVSLFFLDQSLGWLVSRDGGIWKTTEFGRDWTCLARLPGAMRVHFVDRNRGWAVGARKSIWESGDGGKHWRNLPVADEPKTTHDFTAYACIAFANPTTGLIAGWSRRPRMMRRVPDWMDPESRPRELPSVSLLLDTHDGGAHWHVTEASLFGRVTQARLAPDGRGLNLIEFWDAFDWPSEVFRFDWRTGHTERVFRQKDRAVTDIALPSQGPAYLAAIEPPGMLPRSPIPGKLKILRSDDLSHWQEMEVDYRAVAHRAILAAPDAANLWVATDTGMILQLVRE